MTDNSRTRDRLLALAAIRHDGISYPEMLDQAAVITGLDRKGDVLDEAMDDLICTLGDQVDLQRNPGRAGMFLDDGDSWRDPLAAAEAELDRRISDALHRLGA